MFNDVLANVRGNLTDQAMGRVVINNQCLHVSIVMSLKNVAQLSSKRVMSTIEKLLQSHRQLMVDDSFKMTVATIEVPKGGIANSLLITKL